MLQNVDASVFQFDTNDTTECDDELDELFGGGMYGGGGGNGLQALEDGSECVRVSGEDGVCGNVASSPQLRRAPLVGLGGRPPACSQQLTLAPQPTTSCNATEH